MSSRKLHVAIVGVGYWGPNLVRNILTSQKVNNVSVFDIDTSKSEQISAQYPQVSVAKSYESILNEGDIDAIVVATPISTHYPLALQAINASKHVLVEKPMTKSLLESRKLVHASKSNNVVLMVGHTFVYSESVKKIKEIIRKGTLGKVYYYDSTRINLGMLQSDANVVWDLATHDLSIIDYLFDESPVSVQTFASCHVGTKEEELSHVFFRYRSGMVAHIHVSWLSPVKIRRVLIGGSKKMVVYDDIEPTEKLKIYNKGIDIDKSAVTPFRPAYRSGSVSIPAILQQEALFNQTEHFLDCILHNKTPITNGRVGLRVVSLLEAIQKSAKTGKQVTVSV